jgi:hypothetical protein
MVEAILVIGIGIAIGIISVFPAIISGKRVIRSIKKLHERAALKGEGR